MQAQTTNKKLGFTERWIYLLTAMQTIFLVHQQHVWLFQGAIFKSIDLNLEPPFEFPMPAAVSNCLSSFLLEIWEGPLSDLLTKIIIVRGV